MNNEIKSQDDLGTQGRESDVLIATITKCQELEQENESLKNKIKAINEQIMDLRVKVNFWKNGFYITTEKSALFHVEKTLINIQDLIN